MEPLDTKATATTDETVNLNDERTKILEDRSPVKTRDDNPILTDDLKGAAIPEKKYQKNVSEYKVFGSGNTDLLCCRFDPEDTLIASGGSDGNIYIYTLSGTGEKPLHVMNAAEVPGIPITSLRWRPQTGASKTKQILVSACADGNISHWHVPSGKLLHRIMEPDNQILCLDYSRDGTNFATAGKDRKIRIYDENTKSKLVELAGGIWQYPGHSNRIFSIKFNPEDPNVIVSAGWDNTVYFWDLRDGKSFASIYGPAVSGDALDIKGNTLLTGSWRNKDQLELWDIPSRKKISNIPWEEGYEVENAYIYACQFSKSSNDTILAGCSNLNEVKVFDRRKKNSTYGAISHLPKGVYSVDYANNTDIFAFCGGEGKTHIVQINK